MSAVSEQLSAVAALGRGEALRWSDPSHEQIEGPLGPVTDQLRADAARGEGLAGVDLEAALERAEHVFVPFRELRVHLEVHEAGGGRPTLVVQHGLGDHARRFTPLAARLHGDGWNVVLVDRPGHGVSEGARGHCPLPWALDLVELTARYARERFGGPVAMLGDSLGGITCWYALTREPDIDAAVCHCIGHPDVHHQASMRWRAPLMRAIGRVVPGAPISVHQIADYDNVAIVPSTQSFFDEQRDIAFNFRASAASVASYLRFAPARPWQRVEIPVRVEIGELDAMVTPEFTRASFERDHPPGAEFDVVPGAGHQLYLDHLDIAYPRLLGWLERAVA